MSIMNKITRMASDAARSQGTRGRAPRGRATGRPPARGGSSGGSLARQALSFAERARGGGARGRRRF